jgi:catechol 2,3-dioxygenase-like lactoylglutathione lyase family enzyme
MTQAPSALIAGIAKGNDPMVDGSKSYSGFAVKDIEEARGFYGDTLGLDARVSDGGMLQLQLGDRIVFVYPKPDFEPATYTILNFPVPDVDKAVDELVKSGVTMERYEGAHQDEKGIARGGPQQGPTIAWFKDPAGNILSVHSDEPM